VSKEQLVKLLTFSQLTVQYMSHIKDQALDKSLNVELKFDRHISECQRLQRELNMTMIESCRLMALCKQQGIDVSRVSVEVNSPEAKSTLDMTRPHERAEHRELLQERDDKLEETRSAEELALTAQVELAAKRVEDLGMLRDMVWEMKRTKLVSSNEGENLDAEMKDLDDESKLWDVLTRYEETGNLTLAVKDIRRFVFVQDPLNRAEALLTKVTDFRINTITPPGSPNR